MKIAPITIQLRFAWWFRWLYLPGLYAMALLGFEPDSERFAATIRRAARFRLLKRIEVAA